jgi:hypothetical protein
MGKIVKQVLPMLVVACNNPLNRHYISQYFLTGKRVKA